MPRSMAGPLLPTPEQEPLADQYVGGLAGSPRFYNMANQGRIQPIIGEASLPSLIHSAPEASA